MNTSPNVSSPPAGVSSSEVARRTGATLRQLQYWDENGYISPDAHVGHRRLYSEDQVVLVRRMIMLRKAGVPMRMVGKCLQVPGWDSVRAVDRILVVGGILIVPALDPATALRRIPENVDSKPLQGRPAATPLPSRTTASRLARTMANAKRHVAAVASALSDAELDAIALRDPSVASGREASI